MVAQLDIPYERMITLADENLIRHSVVNGCDVSLRNDLLYFFMEDCYEIFHPVSYARKESKNVTRESLGNHLESLYFLGQNYFIFNGNQTVRVKKRCL